MGKPDPTSLPVYCIGGLGVDERVFRHYFFPGDRIVLPYTKREPGETIETYARRMAETIGHENFILLGVSFGGILAQQIALIKKPVALVLISTISHSGQIPWYYRLALRLSGRAGLWLAWHTDFPFLRNYVFTASSSADRKTLQKIYESTDFELVAWSIPHIMRWRGVSLPENLPLLRLHGCRDKLFPESGGKGRTHCIKGAGHFMAVSHQSEVNRKINEFLRGLG